MLKRIPILFILTFIIFGIWTNLHRLPMFSRAASEVIPLKVRALRLLALAPINQLSAEEVAMRGGDFLAGLLDLPNESKLDGEVRIATLTDEAGVCVPSEYGPFGENLASNLRRYNVRFVYLPHSSCRPLENIPSSLGGFVDLSAQKLEISPFITFEVANQKVLLVHMPDEDYSEARRKVLEFTASTDNQIAKIISWQYLKDDVATNATIKSGAEAAVVIKSSDSVNEMSGHPVFSIGTDGAGKGYQVRVMFKDKMEYSLVLYKIAVGFPISDY